MRIGTVADCCTIPVAAATTYGAASRYCRGSGGGRRRRGHPGIHGRRRRVDRRRVRRRSVARRRRVRLGLDDHLRPLADDAALIIRDHERGVLLLRDAHVVTGVCLFHYVPRARIQQNGIFVKFRKFRRPDRDKGNSVFPVTVEGCVCEGFSLVLPEKAGVAENYVINLVAGTFTV